MESESVVMLPGKVLHVYLTDGTLVHIFANGTTLVNSRGGPVPGRIAGIQLTLDIPAPGE